MKKMIALIPILLAIVSLGQKKKVDLLIFNAKIYTVDKKFSTATAIAIANGRIEDVGSTKALQAKYIPVQSLNIQGKYIYPGFIDAHAHFYRYSLGLQTANLVGT